MTAHDGTDLTRDELLKVGGHKDDKGKLHRPELAPPAQLMKVFALYAEGAKKYEDDQYMGGMSYRRVAGAMLRHLFAWLNGEDFDPEAYENVEVVEGEPPLQRNHLTSVIWGALTLLEYQDVYPELDDRWPKVRAKWAAQRAALAQEPAV